MFLFLITDGKQQKSRELDMTSAIPVQCSTKKKLIPPRQKLHQLSFNNEKRFYSQGKLGKHFLGL